MYYLTGTDIICDGGCVVAEREHLVDIDNTCIWVNQRYGFSLFLRIPYRLSRPASNIPIIVIHRYQAVRMVYQVAVSSVNC